MLFRFEQELITDPAHPDRLKYPGSQVWLRRTQYFSLYTSEYLAVQVVDGNGNKIETAWNEFQEQNRVVQVIGLKDDRVDERQRC